VGAGAVRGGAAGVHLGQCGGGLRQAGLLGQADQRIGARPVLGHVVAIEVGDAQEVLRARIAMSGGGLHIGHGAGVFAALEQQQAIVVRCLEVALGRRLAEQLFGAGKIRLDAATQLVGLRQVELCIGIALRGRALPFANGSCMIPARPCLDSRLDVGKGWRGQRDCACGETARCHFYQQFSYVRFHSCHPRDPQAIHLLQMT
jgi:hypothetical protein